MGTLYVVGAPAGNPGDLTGRGQRLLREAALITANDSRRAQELLAYHDLATPVAPAGALEVCLAALASADVALLCEGEGLGPCGAAARLIQAAVERGFPVVSAPGPTLPISTLAVSGLPADSFLYLGELPREPAARRDLLSSVSGSRRTLVALEAGCLDDLLVELRQAWGERPLVLAWAGDQVETVWRGTLQGALDDPPARPGGLCVLVVGGAPREPAPWPMSRLEAEVRARLERGESASAIGRRLAQESGWPRREVYQLAVQANRQRPVG